MKDLASCRVLIVDDVKTNVDLLVNALRGDYQLSVALDGESALRIARATQPDLVLLDIMMPGIDGYEVCRRLKADATTRDTPVVFLSALEETQSKTRGFELGAADYITKPFEMLEVKARVRALLRAKAYQEAARELLLSELRIAHEIQMSVVPHDFTPWAADGRLDVFARLKPARDIGGDLYDVFALDRRRVAVAIGDVSGKGIPASLLMMMTTTLVRSLLRLSGQPGTVLAAVNEELAADNPSCMFVTLFCGVLDLDTGVLTYASGGHLPPVHINRRARLVEFESTGTAVGLLPDITFNHGQVRLVPGDTLLLYTDGVTESFDAAGTCFGDERLLTLLTSELPATAEATVEAVLEGVGRFARGVDQADDIAMLALRFHGAVTAEKTLALHATGSDVARALDVLRAFGVENHVDGETIGNLAVALDEILSNVVRHGYKDDPAGVIGIALRCRADVVTIAVRDRAPAWDPKAIPAPAFDRPLEDRPEGGMGVPLVRSLVDTVEYARRGNENHVLLTKRRAAI